ncbi:hypothetical protein GCM10010520_11430 [Rhizobium viscosum]|uniref:Uncharacterized protein n=1 Tax=Rhizobium viscosum TaxID=1673 RepID=A0ABR9IYK9_RHIVS|nr:hypothetical protein [Rhizobium viscosum]MBE1508309.1 hypothetical protein [Rhizobium viscosum]
MITAFSHRLVGANVPTSSHLRKMTASVEEGYYHGQLILSQSLEMANMQSGSE